MIWRLLDRMLSEIAGRLLRLSPVDPNETPEQQRQRRWLDD
jgi:hypothetical protein